MLKIQKISANHTPKYIIEWEGKGGEYIAKISLLEDNNRIIGKLGGVPRTFGQDCSFLVVYFLSVRNNSIAKSACKVQ